MIAAFVLLLVVPAGTVVWLGLHLVVRDRELEAEARRGAQVYLANQAAAVLAARLQASAGALTSQAAPGEDAVLLLFRPDAIETRPSVRLPYYPSVPNDEYALLDTFAPGEALEHQKKDLRGAEAAYRRLTRASTPNVRAGALLRLARVLRRQERYREALAVYDQLADQGDTAVDGVPAELVARRARLLALEALGDAAVLREEAAVLFQGLVDGRWTIDRGTFQSYSTEADRWLGSPEPLPAMRLALAEAAAWVWERRGGEGRHAFRMADADAVVLWDVVGDGTVALVAGPAFQQREWLEPLRDIPAPEGLRLDLVPVGGGRVDRDHGDARAFVRAASDALPWHIVVTDEGAAPGGAARRRVMLAGIGVLLVLMVAGGWVVARAVSRELAVARLQSEFVATVSHEFRTPLTSLRQFTDLLTDTPDLPDEKRRRFYAAQARATDRLHRLVESLLDFRRMEAGAQVYERQRLPAGAFVRSVVENFRPEAEARGFQIALDDVSGACAVDADPHALSLALGNLLDNAVKYSGESRTISVSVARKDRTVAVAVTDCGIGIPRHEQREIFGTFVRGRGALLHGITGTGLGLAMVRQIVHGHGGRVTVESAPGSGSTFTVVLPAAA